MRLCGAADRLGPLWLGLFEAGDGLRGRPSGDGEVWALDD
jgi:hypothetical protein